MNENVNVCITPKGDKPVLHFSQFDNERVFTVTVLADDGESAAVLTGLDIEFRLRKTDSHVVTIAPESVADNVITFKTTEQMCACCGQNIASVVLMDNEMIVSTLDILVDIQRDILSGGLTSESDIRNLTTQIEQIVPEVLGDDYYNKQEVDDLLAEHTFDPTNYYNKSDVDDLLADKADSDDVYTKTETDDLLADKADKLDTYSKSDVDSLLMDRMSNIEFTAYTPGTYSMITFNSLYKAPIIDIEAVITESTNTINLFRTGKNKLPLSVDGIKALNAGTWVGNSITLANVTFTILTDTNGNVSGIKANGTANAAMLFIISNFKLPSGSYSLNGNASGGSYNRQLQLVSGATPIASDNGSGSNFNLSGSTSLTARIRIGNGETVSNVIFTPMVRDSSSSDTFEPYKGQVKTIALGQTVSSGSVDFARGIVNDSGNVITFTPVTLDSIVGENNVYIDVGDMTSLTYVSKADLGLMALLEAYTLR